MTIRPATPAETALFVQLRDQPNIIIFPPEIGVRGGRIVISEDIKDEDDGGAVRVLSILEWARLSMLKYYGIEDKEEQK